MLFFFTSAAPFQHMTPTLPRILDSVCLPYRGKPEQTPLWEGWREWSGEPTPGHFYCEDLEDAREQLHQAGYLPRVKRSHKADLKRLNVTLGKSTMVIIQAPKHAAHCREFARQSALNIAGRA